MLHKFEIECGGCGKTTLVLTKPEDPEPQYCPLCSHQLFETDAWEEVVGKPGEPD